MGTALSYAQVPYTYVQPKTLGDGWETTSLKAQGVDSTAIYNLFSQMHAGGNRIHSLLLVKNNQLLIEEYFNDYPSQEPHDLRSVTKSIISLLVGIAIDKGYIESVDDMVSKYLKNPVPVKNIDSRKENIMIKHLLMMSGGLDCNDWDAKSEGQEDKVYKKRDWLQYTLDLPMLHNPGEVSAYCTMGVVLLAELISQASGMPIDVFAETYLFRPLGITNLRWGHTSNKEVIPSAKRLYMTSRDMAKIGQLVLNNGTQDGEQIVSKQWIAASTATQTTITGMDYGYLWWQIPLQVKGKEIRSVAATGNGGQYIMIFPELDIVAVFTGGAYNSEEDKLPFVLMANALLPLFLK